MGLRIALRNGEKVVVNGAVLRSIGRTELHVEGTAAILRGKDIMRPDEASSPARQLYFHTMMAYIDPAGIEGHQKAIIDALQTVTAVLGGAEASAAAMRYAAHAAGLCHYQALAECRTLVALEQAALSSVAVAA